MFKMKVRSRLEIPSMFFQKEFLETEVTKKLAIRGDDLIYQLKEQYRDDPIRMQKDGLFFTRDELYVVDGIEDDHVILIES